MQEIRAMFSEKGVRDWVRDNLIPAKEYHPYPKPEEREFWGNLAPELQSHLIQKGEEYLNYEWKGLPATVFLEYQRSGNRYCYEELSFAKRMALGSLMMAECVENKGRFLDNIINGIWSICEESTWAISAHIGGDCKHPGVLPDALEDSVLELFCLETAQLMAFSYYLFKEKLDAVAPQIAARIQGELQRRIFKPYLTRTDCWWMGFHNLELSNWAPWCASNMLQAFMLACDDDEMRADAMNKVCHSFIAVELKNFERNGSLRYC